MPPQSEAPTGHQLAVVAKERAYYERVLDNKRERIEQQLGFLREAGELGRMNVADVALDQLAQLEAEIRDVERQRDTFEERVAAGVLPPDPTAGRPR